MQIMNRAMLFLVLLLTATSASAEPPGLIRVATGHDPGTVLDRLENVLQEKGMTIFKRVHHSRAADAVGIRMRDTELLIFGNPKIGSKLMLCAQTAAIDLPMKALAYSDADGRTWLAYNDPAYLADRHGATGCAVVAKMSAALKKFTAAAAAP